ncbi:hemerythrin domain-containing protein [Salinispora oceanensis]|uniref:hemerythrin domain-containing protein n=1 Tax=Salinispora oceanensis TaxID=1050199 RepID=UPI001CC6A523|nr:hemerythrin domain-containing protein [Salinispora oceanensis]
MSTSGDTTGSGYQVMVVVHRAMVRDVLQISDAARALADRPDPVQAKALCRYGDRVFQLIAHHHEVEDEVFWPMLRSRGAPVETIELMTTEHDELAGLLERARELLADAQRGEDSFAALAEVGLALHQALLTHTADEERELAGRLKPVLGDQEWKVLEREMVRSAPKWTLGFMPPWMASAARPEERKALPAAPIALLMRGSLRRQRRLAFGTRA